LSELREQTIDRIKQATYGNVVLASNLYSLLEEYVMNGISATDIEDKIDWDSVLDPNLSYYENKARLCNYLKQQGYYSEKEMLKDDGIRHRDELTAAQNARRNKNEEAELIEREIASAKYSKTLKEIEESENSPVEEVVCKQIPEMKKFREILDLTLDSSKYINGCIVLGPAGCRKSQVVKNELTRRGCSFALGTSHAAPLGLYELLFKNRTGIVVLDDLETILEDRKSLGILKAAAFGTFGRRTVTWHSTARVLSERGLPNEFDFEGKLIIIANDMPSSKLESFKAFLGRFYVHRMQFNELARKILVRSIFMTQNIFDLSKDKKKELLDYMEGLLDYSKISQYNLRTAMKAAEIFSLRGEDGKALIFELLGTDENVRKLLMIEERAKHLPVSARRNIWKEYTGYSGSSYHLLKSKFYADKYDNTARLEKELQELDEIIEEEGRHL